MDQVDCLRNRVEPFAALFWSFGTVLDNNLPFPLVRHHSTAVHKACSLYGHSLLNSQRRRVAPPPPFLSRYIVYYLSMGMYETKQFIMLCKPSFTWSLSAYMILNS